MSTKNKEFEEFKKSLVNLNLNEIYIIEQELIKNKDYVKLEIVRDYVYNRFLLSHHC